LDGEVIFIVEVLQS